MLTYYYNTINAATLVVVGLVGYFGSDTPSFTALIPVFAGVILLSLFKGLKVGNKTIIYISTAITLLTLLALFKPLLGAISRNDSAAIARVTIMIITGIAAFVAFLKQIVLLKNGDKKV